MPNIIGIANDQRAFEGFSKNIFKRDFESECGSTRI
jgi:hypothetical protein